ncbi:putative RNA-binding protein Luc7-like 1 isoform X3 [Eurytemora carolleeae]|uniref:putative RNA-binding protein Luc7-like 1 isoform X3 n=1 Tax=Eurytemora carolleeae TaxID=1294199 RepID=UPI000C77F1C5|nr:putative RNA-binding protein Luc7-like 1 isoform X3 [Eurytemora carolleeae]|eukprot:XP_023324251.1 putative RNA-binding protein Luc7-like 1 isoform X3 [Eurytemora affinis]
MYFRSMTATDQMRAMLDAMMGTARNGEASSVRFNDHNVCKSFLLSCCPHDLLAATRMDIGECSRIHDLGLRADYELAQKSKDYFYDVDAFEHLSAFVADCDRKTESSKIKLAETQEMLSDEVTTKANLVHDLAEQIGKKLASAEQMGAEGEVEESMKLMEEVEEIRKVKAEAEQDYRNSMPASSYQQQKLRVCEVCSAYLGIHDNDRRLADHFGGKLHLGFIQIREKLEELKKNKDERLILKREAKMFEMERGEYEIERPPPPEDRRRRERSRDRSREKRRRSRSRSRDRRKRSRSRSRGHRRHKRSRSRERRRRSGSRKRRVSQGQHDSEDFMVNRKSAD